MGHRTWAIKQLGETKDVKEREVMITVKRLAILILFILMVGLQSCSASANLNLYTDIPDGYRFVYPNGWMRAQVSNGPDVVFRDLVEQTENVSVVISEIPGDRTLSDLGSPTEVGQTLTYKVIAPPESGREAELISVDLKEQEGKSYYFLEYAVKRPDMEPRHNLASVVANRGRLYTFNVSTTEVRWPKMEKRFREVVRSFVVS